MSYFFKIFFAIFVFFTSLDLHAGRRKVLLIGIDGVRSDILSSMNLSIFNKFESHGFGTYTSWNQDITMSGPSWTSVLCGVYHDKHGIVDNSFAGNDYKRYPMIPNLLKEVQLDLKCGIYMEWKNLMVQCEGNGWHDLFQGSQGNTAHTRNKTTKWIQTTDLDFYFVYFGAPDFWGHRLGFSKYNPFYKWALRDVNKAIEDLEKSIHSRKDYEKEDWLILTTTDHGGKANGHGGYSAEERQVFWFAYSERIKPFRFISKDEGSINMCNNSFCNRTIRKTPVHVDILSTAIHHLLYESCVEFEECINTRLEGRSWLYEMGLCSNKFIESTASNF